MMCVSRKQRGTAIVLFLLIAGQLVFIFSNSHKNADASDKQSSVFVRFYIEQIEGKDFESASQTHIDTVTHYVRKTAHFTEYAVLCFLIVLFWRSIRRESKGKYIAPCTVFLGFAVGYLDEFSQSFSPGRANRFTDVLIDTSGGLFGCLTALFLLCVGARLYERFACKTKNAKK